jgi:hypothetical protein
LAKQYGRDAMDVANPWQKVGETITLLAYQQLKTIADS